MGPNDYASMEEVLTRRFTHENDSSFDAMPDLIMMDGGRGQVNICPVSYTHLLKDYIGFLCNKSMLETHKRRRT